jgi:ATP-dependent Lhr-like helicase
MRGGSTTPTRRPAAQIGLDYVGSIANAAKVASALYRGEKRLVFCETRRRVEELSLHLRTLGVTTFVSHSSLSVDERHRAEQAFAEARDCVIVSTSTLELGIDVGDLDRVIQLDAPVTVASFLQRLGRTGRRPGSLQHAVPRHQPQRTDPRGGLLLQNRSSNLSPRREAPASQPNNSRSACAGRVGDTTWQHQETGLPILTTRQPRSRPG